LAIPLPAPGRNFLFIKEAAIRLDFLGKNLLLRVVNFYIKDDVSSSDHPWLSHFTGSGRIAPFPDISDDGFLDYLPVVPKAPYSLASLVVFASKARNETE
jgi:hypothetical protein